MSFSQIKAELKTLKGEIHKINEYIKQLVIQMKLINITFEVTLKTKTEKIIYTCKN